MIYYRYKINENMPRYNESLISGQRSNFNFFSLEFQSIRWLTNPRYNLQVTVKRIIRFDVCVLQQ